MAEKWLGGNGLVPTLLDAARAWIEVYLNMLRQGASRSEARHYAWFSAAVRWRS